MAEQDSWRGKLGRMSQEEIRSFLAGACLMRLACLKNDGRPYIVPMWYEWDGESFWVIPRKKSSWAQYLATNKYCCGVIDEDVPPLRKVQVEGEAYLIEEPNVGGKWVAIAERMSVRYLGEHGPDYLQPTMVEPRWLFRIQPEKITTWQGAGWAKRYHVA
jgi:nitroimidazol reductase NimA-like FMN-containing flavoprotein (pyridoxamine 5'-phosphate oxidase superfamily)